MLVVHSQPLRGVMWGLGATYEEMAPEVARLQKQVDMLRKRMPPGTEWYPTEGLVKLAPVVQANARRINFLLDEIVIEPGTEVDDIRRRTNNAVDKILDPIKAARAWLQSGQFNTRIPRYRDVILDNMQEIVRQLDSALYLYRERPWYDRLLGAFADIGKAVYAIIVALGELAVAAVQLAAQIAQVAAGAAKALPAYLKWIVYGAAGYFGYKYLLKRRVGKAETAGLRGIDQSDLDLALVGAGAGMAATFLGDLFGQTPHDVGTQLKRYAGGAVGGAVGVTAIRAVVFPDLSCGR